MIKLNKVIAILIKDLTYEVRSLKKILFMKFNETNE